MKIFSNFKITIALACTCYAGFFSLPAKAQTGKLDDGKGAFATGKYPSLFRERGHSKKEILQQ